MQLERRKTCLHLSSLKIDKKYTNFGKKMVLFVCIYGLNAPLKCHLRISWRKSKCLSKCLSKCFYSKKPALPREVPGCVPVTFNITFHSNFHPNILMDFANLPIYRKIIYGNIKPCVLKTKNLFLSILKKI